MTASTGKAVTGINGITLCSAFHLPVKSGLKSYEYKKPDDETLHMSRNIPVLESFANKLNINDRKGNFWTFRSSIKSYHAKIVTIWWSFFVSCRFFQLPPVNQKGVFMRPSKR